MNIGFEDLGDSFNRKIFDSLQERPFDARGVLTLRCRRTQKNEYEEDGELPEAELIITVNAANEEKIVTEINLMLSPELKEPEGDWRLNMQEDTSQKKLKNTCSLHRLTLDEATARKIIGDAGFDQTQSPENIALMISGALRYSFSSESDYQVSTNNRDSVQHKHTTGSVRLPLRFPPAVANTHEGLAHLEFQLVQSEVNPHTFHLLCEVGFRVPGAAFVRPMLLKKSAFRETGSIFDKRAEDAGDIHNQDQPEESKSQGTKKPNKRSRGSGVKL